MLSVLDRDVLAAAVTVIDEAAMLGRPPIMDHLFQGIQNKAGIRYPAYPPADEVAV